MPKESENCALKAIKKTGLSVKEILTFDVIAKGEKSKTIVQIAGELGCHRNTVYNRLEKIQESDYIKRQVAKLETLEDLNFANTLANILAGNWETTKDIYKGTGVLRDRIEIEDTTQRLTDIEIRDKAKELLKDLFEQFKGNTQKQVTLEAQGDTILSVPDVGDEPKRKE